MNNSAKLLFILGCIEYGMINGMVTKPNQSSNPSLAINRRETLSKTFGILGGAGIATALPFLPEVANAEVLEETPRVTSRLGGLLEYYQDGIRGWSMFVPSGWNKFEGEVGAYDTKWQDVVQPIENIKLSSNPVKSTTTSISALGDVKDVGASLASKRNAKLMKAEERQTEGILFYDFEFAINDGTHQLLTLCVNKGKVWSLDASSSESRWSKRKELYTKSIGSFLPKLAK